MGPGHHTHELHHGNVGGGFWPFLPFAVLSVLLVFLSALWLVRDVGVPALAGPLAGGARARWHAAADRHRQIAAAFAAYECDPQAVLRRPALADVRQPATARFVEAFAEACALATERYPGRAMGERFVAAVERTARAWTAATEAADRWGAARFAPGERALLEQAVELLALARATPHDGERRLAYERAIGRLAELQRTCGWVLPRAAGVVLGKEARRAVEAVPA